MILAFPLVRENDSQKSPGLIHNFQGALQILVKRDGRENPSPSTVTGFFIAATPTSQGGEVLQMKAAQNFSETLMGFIPTEPISAEESAPAA